MSKPHNVMEKLVADVVENIINARSEMCKCEKCRDDILAYALNRVKPSYVSTLIGTTITKAEILDADYSTSLVVIVAEAIEKVRSNPQHERE